MKSRFWLNGIMALVVLVLVVITIYEPGKNTTPTLPRLTQLNKQDVEHIELINHDAQKIELLRRNGQWWMQQPYELPANDFRVQTVLRLLEADSYSQHSLTNLDAAKFGLDKPRATVTFNRDLTVSFGKTESLHHRRYVSVNNNLKTIDDTFYYQVAANVTNYLSHALLPPDSHIQQIKLPDLQLVLENGRWQRTPAMPEISADADIDLINTWRQSQALTLRPGGNKKLDANIEITLSESDTPLAFHLLHRDEESILVRLDNGMQYIIGRDIEEKLTRLSNTESVTESSAEIQLPDASAVPSRNTSD